MSCNCQPQKSHCLTCRIEADFRSGKRCVHKVSPELRKKLNWDKRGIPCCNCLDCSNKLLVSLELTNRSFEDYPADPRVFYRAGLTEAHNAVNNIKEGMRRKDQERLKTLNQIRRVERDIELLETSTKS